LLIAAHSEHGVGSISFQVKFNPVIFQNPTASCEEEIGDRLGRIFQDIRLPDEVLNQIKNGLAANAKRQGEMERLEKQRLEQRLVSVRRRIDQAYLDKLDGNITE
jgi:hypothetical protein